MKSDTPPKQQSKPSNSTSDTGKDDEALGNNTENPTKATTTKATTKAKKTKATTTKATTTNATMTKPMPTTTNNIRIQPDREVKTKTDSQPDTKPSSKPASKPTSIIY